jgi:hypothetical protein
MTDKDKDKLIREIKTQPCKSCPAPSDIFPGLIDFLCPFYHSEHDRRRNPSTYSGVYLEDDGDPAYCRNYVEYLYHPSNFRTEPCVYADCKSRFALCPYYHNQREMRRKEERDGIFANAERILNELKSSQPTDVARQNGPSNGQQGN